MRLILLIVVALTAYGQQDEIRIHVPPPDSLMVELLAGSPMRYENISSLKGYLEQIEAALLSEEKRVAVSFPTAALSPWDGNALVLANRALLEHVSGSASIYAIFTVDYGDKKHSLRYIGKTTKRLARQRIVNHLFRKHEKTGSKLDRVVAHVRDGGAVLIAWVEVDPESIRNYLEEELIDRHREADWNVGRRSRLHACTA